MDRDGGRLVGGLKTFTNSWRRGIISGRDRLVMLFILTRCTKHREMWGGLQSSGGKHISVPLMLEVVLMRFHMIHNMSILLVREA